MKFIAVTLISVLFIGCIKFDDPPIGKLPIPIDYSSPCSSSLTHNNVRTEINDFDVDNYELGTVVLNGTSLYKGNPENADFEIYLGENLTESGRYNFDIFVLADKARMEFSDDQFAAPEYTSISGELFIEFFENDSIIFEWCEIVCQPLGNLNIPNKICSGRMVYYD